MVVFTHCLPQITIICSISITPIILIIGIIGGIMDYSDDGYNDWFMETYETNIKLFAEYLDDEFEEFCLRRYQQRGEDRSEE